MTDRETERPGRNRDWTDRQTDKELKRETHTVQRDRRRQRHTDIQTDRQRQKRENRGERLAGFKVL